MVRRLGVILVVSAIGCGSDAITVCPSDLRVGVAPADTTISVGGQLSPRVTLLGCGGTKVLADSITWTSSNVAAAVVGTNTGTVIGAGQGSAVITATGRTYGRIGSVSVSVR